MNKISLYYDENMKPFISHAEYLNTDAAWWATRFHRARRGGVLSLAFVFAFEILEIKKKEEKKRGERPCFSGANVKSHEFWQEFIQKEEEGRASVAAIRRTVEGNKINKDKHTNKRNQSCDVIYLKRLNENRRCLQNNKRLQSSHTHTHTHTHTHIHRASESAREAPETRNNLNLSHNERRLTWRPDHKGIFSTGDTGTALSSDRPPYTGNFPIVAHIKVS